MAIGILLRTFPLFFVCICRNILEVKSRTSLQDVQFWDAKTNESGASVSVPLILDKKLGSPKPLCYNKAEFHDLTLLSLILCRRLGFLAVERIYPLSKQDLNISNNNGLEMNLQCGGQEILLDQCYIDSLKATSCYDYLGIQCAGCNYTIKMDSYEKLIIGLPDFLPCSPNAFCEWKILMERQVKGLLFEFKMEDNNNGSYIPATTYFKNRRIEVKWHNAENEQWILWTANENTLKYPSKLAIKSRTIILKYFSAGCHFVPQHNIQAIISTRNLQQGYDRHTETISLFYIFVSSGILMVGISILMTCLCCHRRNQKGRSKVQSSFVGNRARLVPDKHEGGSHLIAAFRDFVSTSRSIAYVTGERETEELIFDLETAESLPGSGNKFMKIPDDETDGEEGNRKRCPSFEVKSGLPFSHSPAASKVNLKNIDEKFAEETLEKKNGSSSPELWGSPHSEADTFHSHQSSGSECSYFSIFQSSHTPTSDPATVVCQHSESRRHGTSRHTSATM